MKVNEVENFSMTEILIEWQYKKSKGKLQVRTYFQERILFACVLISQATDFSSLTYSSSVDL